MVNKFSINVLLITLLVTFSLTAWGKSPPPGTGEADVKANILILLDTSGSMNDPVSSIPAPGQLKGPNDVDIDSQRNVHTVNYTGKYVSVHDSSGTGITSYGSVSSNPAKIAIDTSDDSVYTKQGGKLNRYVKGGTNSWTASWSVSLPSACGSNGDDSDIAVDTVTHRIYVSDTSRTTSCAINASDGSLNQSFNLGVSSSYKSAIDATNRVLIVMDNRRRLRLYDLDNLPNAPSNSILKTAGFDARYDIEVDREGNVYLPTHNKIYKYSAWNPASGTGHDLIGSKQCAGQGSVYGIGVDKTVAGSGMVYVPNYGGQKIIKINMRGNNPAAWTCETTITASGTGVAAISRMAAAKNVIKLLMQDSALTDGANFGFMEWGSNATIKVPVKQSGAQEILAMIDNVSSNGGGTHPNNAVVLAKSFYSGTTSYPSPIDANANCQNNFIILLSDGAFSGTSPNSNVLSLYNDLGVKSYIVGFAHQGGSTYQAFATAGQTGAPLYATDQSTLFATLGDAIRQVLQQSLTFSAPKIMPDVNLGDHIFQAVFDYKTRKQWHGRLKKYALANDGTITTPHVWDAGEKLNTKNPNDRKIWTVGSNFADPIGNLNNFVASDLGTIKYDLYAGSAVPSFHNVGDAPNLLLEFVRGKDSYDYDGDGNTTEPQLWMLADIYHSSPAIVGKPPGSLSSTKIYSEAYYRNDKGYSTFKRNNHSRKNIIVVGSNSGMLHAFDNITGEELWAFIPPSLLSKFQFVPNVGASSTNAIYGVDGSPVIKDIYYNGGWKTVLLSGLGRGGNSYFALDITDTLNPKHLFTFKNDPVAKFVYYWDAAGNKTDHDYGPGKTINSDYDFSKLGEAWSMPKIMRIKIAGADKWVAVFGAGFNNNVTNDYGSGVFVIDMEDGGKVLQSIALTDNNDPNSSPVTNQVKNSLPASVVPVTADSTSLAEYYGALVYFADYEGKLWKLNLSSNGTLYDLQYLFDSEADYRNQRRVMYDVAASIDAGTKKLWLYYGTGDQQQLANESSFIANKLYGIKDINFPNYAASTVSVTETSCLNTTNLSVNCAVASNQSGWYFNLGTNLKVTSEPTIFNRNVYFSQYLPNAANPCAPGKAFQSVFSYASGCKTRVDVELGSGVATGATFYRGKMYLGLSGASTEDNTLDGNSDYEVFDNIIVGTPVGGAASSSSQPRIKSWRELK